MSDWLLAALVIVALAGANMASHYAMASEIESIKKECAK